MPDINYISLSKSLTKALRHRPDRLGLRLAPDGSVELAVLIEALNRKGGWPRPITEADIMQVVEHGTKQRLAVEGGRIRARYGHSIPLESAYEPATPPEVLYHGTSSANVASILEEGLLPMGRLTVHLSSDKATALQVGARHGGRTALFIVDSAAASRDGITFYCGNSDTWLADQVPARYLSLAAELPRQSR